MEVGGGWTEDNERGMRLWIRHMESAALVYSDAAAWLDKCMFIFGSLSILLSLFVTAVSLPVAVSCMEDDPPGYCDVLPWILVAASIIGGLLSNVIIQWNPAKMASDYDRTSIDYQNLARQVDIKLQSPPTKRPQYPHYAEKVTNQYTGYKNRGGRLPSWFSRQADQLGELPNLSLLQFFDEEAEHQCQHERLSASAPIHTTTTPPPLPSIPASQPATPPPAPPPPLARSLTRTMTVTTPQDRQLMKKLHQQLARLSEQGSSSQ